MPSAGKYALIIACSEYQDKRLHQLPKTEADAAGMRAVLIDTCLCGFPEGDVELQVNASGGSIKVAIEKFFKNREKDDLLILYFAGHGIIDDHRRLTLALNETDPDYRATGIEARFLREEMENCRSDRQVLILDCCNAGAFARGRDAKGAPAGLQEALRGKGRFVLAASDKLQFSFDEVAGRGAIANGVFTHYLIEGLRGFKAVSANGRTITATSLYSYAHEEVARATEQRQTPVLILPDETRVGELVLAHKPAPKLPETLRVLLEHSDYTQRLAGVYQLRDAVRGGEDYADVARKVLREMVDQPQVGTVHEAITKVLAEFEGRGGPETGPKPGLVEVETAAPQRAAVKTSPKPTAAKKRWAIPLVLLLFVGVGIGFYFVSQEGKEESPVVVDGRPRQEEKSTEDAQRTQAFKVGDVFRDKLKSGGEGPAMVVVPSGEFLMGSPPSEPKRDDDEGPQHPVRIEKAFAIGKYEVTFAQYDAFAEATGREKPDDEGWGRGRRPVINVSWKDAAAHAKWLNKQTVERYRLPSEAEWEYAARAGTTTPFHYGERITTEQANFDGNHTYNDSPYGEYWGKTVEVGRFSANAFGLHDVHGNVWEWVQDCWHDNYNGAPADGSAWESGGCEDRSLRGGGWSSRPEGLRSADRHWWWHSNPYNLSAGGFRLARTL